MGKGAKSDETKQESKEGLLAFEEGFTSKLGAANKCCCCKLSIGVQLIAVLVVLAALNYFLTFVSRTGAPCFFCACLQRPHARPDVPCAAICCRLSLATKSRERMAHTRACGSLKQGTTMWLRPSQSFSAWLLALWQSLALSWACSAPGRPMTRDRACFSTV